MKAKDVKFFTDKSIQNGCRPLLSLGVHTIPADGFYPECVAVVAISIFGEIYYLNPESEVKEIDEIMKPEAERILTEAEIPDEYKLPICY